MEVDDQCGAHTRSRSDDQTHQYSRKIPVVVDMTNADNNRNYDLFKAFFPLLGTQTYLVKWIEPSCAIQATVSVTISEDGKLTGPATMEGKYCRELYYPDKQAKLDQKDFHNFKVTANFKVDNKTGCSLLNGEFVAYVFIEDWLETMTQVLFRRNQVLATIDLNYDYATLQFNRHVTQLYEDRGRPLDKQVWSHPDENNWELDVNKLLQLVPELGPGQDWTEKLKMAQTLFTDFDLD